MSRTERRDALEILDKLTNELDGFQYTHEEILNFIIKNHLGGTDALRCMIGFLDEVELEHNPEFKEYIWK
jgi:hypothetical protein